ncbi:MAG: hypothetical protein WD623_09350 [Marinobacter sp.]|uniref:hypothetical protein n=1 Tax=Marinobacter sp. TaxID=50741 RepID=UPI0034A04685
MSQHEYFIALLAKGSAVPTLLCGHCNSTLSRAKIFRNEGRNRFDIACQTLGLCSADDCGAVNCCDEAMAEIDSSEPIRKMAS